MSTWTRAALTVLIGLIIWFLPHTEAIKPEVGICWLSLQLRLLVLFYALGRRALWHSLALLLLWQRALLRWCKLWVAMQRLMCGLS